MICSFSPSLVLVWSLWQHHSSPWQPPQTSASLNQLYWFPAFPLRWCSDVSRSLVENMNKTRGKKHGRFAYIPVEKRVEKLHLPKLTLNMYTSVQKCNFPTMFHISDWYEGMTLHMCLHNDIWNVPVYEKNSGNSTILSVSHLEQSWLG